MALVNIEIVDGKVEIDSPYNRSFISQIKGQGGKWNAKKKVWTVSEDKAAIAKEIVKSVYGVDVDTDNEIKIKYNAHDFWEDEEIKVGSLTTVKRYSRDSDVTYYLDTYISEGSDFPSSGGSNHYPDVSPEKDTVLVSTISEGAYQTLSDDAKDKITIVDETNETIATLEAKREKLLAKLKAIEKEIEALKAK